MSDKETKEADIKREMKLLNIPRKEAERWVDRFPRAYRDTIREQMKEKFSKKFAADEKRVREQVREQMKEKKDVNYMPEDEPMMDGGMVRKKKKTAKKMMGGGKVYTMDDKRYAYGGKVSGRKAKYNG